MSYTKTFIRESGKKVRITVGFTVDWQGSRWSTTVETCLPKKRTWKDVHSTDDYHWRRLDPEQRGQYVLALHLQHVTPEEIQETRLELWEFLKPEPIFIPEHLRGKTEDSLESQP